MSGSEKVVTVIQGEYRISDDPSVIFSTVLGSCVAVCLCDLERRIGGMSHFLLPSRAGKDGANERYGAYSMELLINGLLKQGAQRSRLRAKLFGGAKMMSNLGDIGTSNARFAHEFLANESIPILGESLGGTSARRIRFAPVTGRAKQLLVAGDVAEVAPIVAPPKPPIASDVTLF